MTNSTRDTQIWNEFTSQEDKNKAAIARKHGLSPRTVGRIIAKFEAKEEAAPLLPVTGLDHAIGTTSTPDDMFDENFEVKAIVGDEAGSEYYDIPFDDGLPTPVVEAEPIQYIITPMAIMMGNGDEVDTIDQTHQNYEGIKVALQNSQWETARSLINVSRSIEEYIQGDISIKHGVFTYKGHRYSTDIAQRIMDHMKEGIEPTSLINFFERLMKNPSYRAANELFGFVSACDLPITEEGYLIAYKKIKSDWKDCHTGTIDNSVGQIVEMQRNLVNEDKNQTCSTGLHFCSKGYLSNFGGDRIVALKIDPADVVSIPTDYNNSKGRACKYEVLMELKDGQELPSYLWNGAAKNIATE